MVLILCSCTGRSVKVKGNVVYLQEGIKKTHELVFDSFELKEIKNEKNMVTVEYEFKDDPEAIGLPKYPTYKGELYFVTDDKALKPILNIVYDYMEVFGPRIKLIDKIEKDNILTVEYDIQLYEQRPAAFGTVEISYELTGNDTEGYEYTVIDYKSDLTSHFKRTDDEDPASMISSMEGDVIKPVDLSLEDFESIANQVLGIKKADNSQDQKSQTNESENSISQESSSEKNIEADE